MTTKDTNTMKTPHIYLPEPAIKEAKFGGSDSFSYEQAAELVELANSRIEALDQEIERVRKESEINARAYTKILEELAQSKKVYRVTMGVVGEQLRTIEALREQLGGKA